MRLEYLNHSERPVAVDTPKPAPLRGSGLRVPRSSVSLGWPPAGRKPTLSTYRMLCWHFSGWAEQDELLRHISKLQRQDAVEKTE
ncbi:MAG: hypothetical protein BWX88_02900 [Planctomycetes bacterium ADurb.Bin126]|nr:MAG: hypothetical protein BWX88_02900 [Planctomycetes bacterium ADurb.Bin126]